VSLQGRRHFEGTAPVVQRSQLLGAKTEQPVDKNDRMLIWHGNSLLLVQSDYWPIAPWITKRDALSETSAGGNGRMIEVIIMPHGHWVVDFIAVISAGERMAKVAVTLAIRIPAWLTRHCTVIVRWP